MGFGFSIGGVKGKKNIYHSLASWLPSPLGGVWEQSFSAVLEEYCSILKYCSIIYIMVFGKLGKISAFKTEVL
jgi:hypothetical protein